MDMKIVLTNDEWKRAPWYHRAFAVIGGYAALLWFLAMLAILVLLAVLGVYLLTAIPLKIYLAVLVVLLLVIVLRLDSKGTHKKKGEGVIEAEYTEVDEG